MDNFSSNFILAPGAILDGQYRIESVIGKGGMGVVYLARHTLLNSLVAIKLVLPNLANEQYMQRFLREGQVARMIQHPNIINIYDLRSTQEGIVYMAMEYFDGHTLAKELEKRKRFTPAEAVEILEPISNALQLAHSHGVIHRDLHPSNVMIKEISPGRYQVKLLDLGLAKVHPTVPSEERKFTQLTMVGQILGTPYYMSPEQWEPKSENDVEIIDERTDIYSLGIVFYELVSGRKPFSGQTIQNLAYQHAAVVPPSLNELDQNIPKKFSDVIAKAMSKDKDDRQSNIEQLFSQLKEAVFSPLTAVVENLGQKGVNVLTISDSNNISKVKPRSGSLSTKLIIKHVSGSKSGQTEEFSLSDYPEITFGRDPSSNIVYDPYKDTLVARQQGKITMGENLLEFYIVDNNSRNGTFVNNQKVTNLTRIKPGDTVRFGHQGPEFQFDIFPRPIPPTEVDKDIFQIPPTQVEKSFPLTKVEGVSVFNATLTENLVIKHIKGSKTGQINTFPTKDLREITIGREPMSIIRFDSDKDDLVSNRHAKICLESGVPTKFVLVDLHSRNGTYVNNQRVVESILIKTGDKIRLGSTGPEFEVSIC